MTRILHVGTRLDYKIPRWCVSCVYV
jgi:hypothetical protein